MRNDWRAVITTVRMNETRTVSCYRAACVSQYHPHPHMFMQSLTNTFVMQSCQFLLLAADKTVLPEPFTRSFFYLLH
jgi:hypothetical protein